MGDEQLTRSGEQLADQAAEAGQAEKKSPESHRQPGRGRQAINFALPLWQSLFLFLIPLMLSNALQSIGGTVSSVLLGRFIGEADLAAASSVFPVTFFLISFVIGLGSASSVLIGQAYGSGNAERMKATVGTSLSFAFLLGLLMAVVGNLFSRDLLMLIATPESILDRANHFSHILFSGLPILFVYINYTTFLRGSGDSKTPFYFLFVSTGLNVLLTALFVLGLFGLPRMGVAGSAWATVLSTMITLILFLLYLRRVNHPLSLDRQTIRKLIPDRQIMRLIVKIGLPTSINMIFVSLSEIAVISFVNQYGAHATAAYGAVNQIVNYVQMPAMSLGIATGIFGAQLIGAQKQDRLGELVKSAVLLNYLIGAILTSVVYLFSGTVLSWFLTDPVTLATAEKLLLITLWSYMLFGNSMIISGTMRASGTVLWPMLIGIFSIWGIEVPAAYLLSRQIGITGIWMSYPIAFAFSLVAQYIYYRLFWKNRQHRRFFDSGEKN